MITVKELLQNKPDVTWTIGPDASVYEALEMMADKDIGALPVIEGRKMCGIFSERDYARNVALKGRTSRSTPVRDLMVKSVVCVRLTTTVPECMQLITQKRVRHLPVLEERRLVGIVTIGDVVKQIISEQQHTIEQLESYIQGTL